MEIDRVVWAGVWPFQPSTVHGGLTVEVPLTRATGQLAREPRFLNSSPSESELCSHTILLLLPSHPLLFAASGSQRSRSGTRHHLVTDKAYVELLVQVAALLPLPAPEMQIRQFLDWFLLL